MNIINEGTEHWQKQQHPDRSMEELGKFVFYCAYCVAYSIILHGPRLTFVAMRVALSVVAPTTASGISRYRFGQG